MEYRELPEEELKKRLVKNQENYEHIRASLHELRGDLQKISNQIEEQAMIVIRNGGGREVRYKSEQFFQMVYDKMFKQWNWKNAMLLIKDIGIVVALVYTLFLLKDLI